MTFPRQAETGLWSVSYLTKAQGKEQGLTTSRAKIARLLWFGESPDPSGPDYCFHPRR